jgi:hypothetical protein
VVLWHGDADAMAENVEGFVGLHAREAGALAA